MSLSGKVAIVTGTSPNIGGGIAEGLAAAGAKVGCLDVDPGNVDDCAAAIREAGGEAIGIRCDVRSLEQVEEAVARVRRELGRLDVLVNNAAIFNQKGLLDMSLEEWANQTGVILTGAFLCSKVFARHLVEQGEGGAIVNIVSTAGHQGQPGNVAYCTAKSGLLNFTRSVAMELARHRIRVNSLTPTATDPRDAMARAERWGRPETDSRILDFFEAFRRGVPMQELPDPTDYARAVVFLASDDARHVTGADLCVDAGALARYWAWNPSG